jgi:hypothetical protein
LGYGNVGHVGRRVVERNVFPNVERARERLARLRIARGFRAFVHVVAPSLRARIIASSATRLAWRRRDAVGMADRAAAELQHDVFSEVVQQLVHLPRVDAARGDRHHGAERAPVLVEVHAVQRVGGDEILAQDIVEAGFVVLGSPSSLPTTVPAWIWSTPSRRHHFAMTRKLTP